MDESRIRKKLQLARQELLDLGLRNPLLNYRTLKGRGLEIINENPPDIYRILVAEKKKMSFAAVQEGQEAKSPIVSGQGNMKEADRTAASSANSEQRFQEAFSGQSDGQSAPLPADEQRKTEAAGDREPNLPASSEYFLDSRLQTPYTAKQLESRLLSTYYYARTYIEEQGVNILYIALGMLHWYESDSSKECRNAPLVLVPVQLDRVSAKERFTIAYTEDEIGFNISLAAKLKADFGLDLPSFPEDGELDLDAYFAEVRRAIEGFGRWSVDSRSVVLGFFSFGKFLMFRDLDPDTWPEHARPEHHPVLSALLQDGFREETSRIADDEKIDPHFSLSETNHVMDADSSQIAAILDAMEGRNMVVQGPPGTGKSQTITNLIAEAIGRGKKVLFVSEKMAALEVVKRRLDRLGLGVACLELHSHKTNKKALLHELSATLDLGRPKYSDNGEVQLLEQLRTRLNEYCDAVNTEVGDTGTTPYAALGELVRVQQEYAGSSAPFPKLLLPSLGQWSRGMYQRRAGLVEELQKLIASIGSPRKHPFWGSGKSFVLPAEIEELRQSAGTSLEHVRVLSSMAAGYAADFHCPAPQNPDETKSLTQVLEKALAAPDLNGIALNSGKWTQERSVLEQTLEAGFAYRSLRQKHENRLIPEAWEQDLLETRQTLVRFEGKWWRFLSGDFRKARNRVLGLCKQPKEVRGDLLEIVDDVMEARRLKDKIQSCEPLAQELFPSEWKGAESDWERLSALIPWVIELRQDLQDRKLPEWTAEFLSLSMDRSKLEEAFNRLSVQLNETERSIRLLEQIADFRGEVRFENGLALLKQPFQTVQDLLETWAGHADQFQEIAAYNHLVAECAKEELQPVVELAEHWERAGGSLAECFRWHRNQAIVSRAFEERPALAAFDRSRHEHAVQKFRELDRCLAEFNRAKLAEMHWKMLPKYEAGGQLGVLRREFEKKTRHLPIRQLMMRAGKAIQAIKPVFMMGPLSIAAYLQPGSLEFDLVIFDEASQVKPVDAFGAIIRGKQAIVVGDSKQMPPTNFFDTISKEEDDGEEEHFVADMESILGLFVGQNAPQRMLRWHYRSRHESLIAVSNHEFYDHKLVIFPSPDRGKHQAGLKFNYLPDTAYDRGRSRTNKLEAKAVAQAVLEHAEQHPHLTLGVAAFSMAQMQAILDEIERLRREHAVLENFIAAHPHEPFFVKNLENVQGDERDVIFISIGYGKTSEGYLSMDFGPLNRTGGERRLNVLITRARVRCEVFTNLKADDIDLSRTDSRGVQSLKTFLKYAESGSLDIPKESGKLFDSPFEEAVYDALTKLGYEVKPQVGSAGFFIDLAVVDPSAPGRYLLGIECDGAAYHSARSARDRDRLRQEVLEGLGWNIHRIWSTDWFRHPERELKRAVEAIEKAKLQARISQPAGTGRKPKQQAEAEIEREDTDESQSAARAGVETYRVCELAIDLNGKEFHQLPLSLVASWVAQVVSVEGPVHAGEVMKRICEAAGIKRAGRRIQELFERSFELLDSVEQRGEFLWPAGMDVPPIRDRSGLKTKKFELIANEEYQEAILKAVRECFGAEEEDVAAAVYQTLGFARATEDMRNHLSAIISELVEQGKLGRNDRVLVLKT
jgi:very-short-patch-repair endonuclease